MDSSLDYCRKSLERSDYHHYLISLFMPAGKRPALWTLGAFKQVIETIPQSVTEPALGYMRLTWWRDQIALLEQDKLTRGQPILSSLSVIAREQRDRGNPDIFQQLKTFINDHEILIENPETDFISAIYPKLLEQILGPDFIKYRSLEHKLTTILKRYHGDKKWEKNPPFLALRLWLAS